MRELFEGDQVDEVPVVRFLQVKSFNQDYAMLGWWRRISPPSSGPPAPHNHHK